MRARVKARRPGRYKAIALAVLVHVLVIGLLLVSFRWSSDSSRPAERVIQATALKDSVSEKARKDDAEKREAEEAKKQAEAERKKREAEEAKRRAELERKKREAEAAAKRAEAERKKRTAAEAKKRAEAERKKREAEATAKRAEAERRQREAEQALRESLVAEERAREDAARAARAATEVDRYKALIIQKVERNWSKPPGAKGLQCVLKVRVVPGGEVVAVKVVQSSGNAVFDDSVQNAVHKSTPLPLPADPSLFEYLREIEFTFRPPAG